MKRTIRLIFLVFVLVSCDNSKEIQNWFLKKFPQPEKYQEDYDAHKNYCLKINSMEECNNIPFCTYHSDDCISWCINYCSVNFWTEWKIKDNVNYVYYKWKKLYNIDNKTFKEFPNFWWLEYAIDNKHIICNWWKRTMTWAENDIKIFNSNNTEKFQLINCKEWNQRKYYYTDTDKLFYWSCILQNNFDFNSIDSLCEDDERFIKDSKWYIYKWIRITDEEYKILSNWTLWNKKYRKLYTKYEKITENLIYWNKIEPIYIEEWDDKSSNNWSIKNWKVYLYDKLAKDIDWKSLKVINHCTDMEYLMDKSNLIFRENFSYTTLKVDFDSFEIIRCSKAKDKNWYIYNWKRISNDDFKDL